MGVRQSTVQQESRRADGMRLYVATNTTSMIVPTNPFPLTIFCSVERLPSASGTGKDKRKAEGLNEPIYGKPYFSHLIPLLTIKPTTNERPRNSRFGLRSHPPTHTFT